jgi:glutamyl-tRNA synthetase
MGWSYGGDQEKFTLEQMIERFDLVEGSVSLSGPVFDLDKLSWLNGLYLRELSDEELVDQVIGWRLNRDYFLRLAPLVRERIRRFDEFVPLTSYFFSGDLDYADVARQLIPKKREPGPTAKMLERLADELDALPWEAEALEQGMRDFCEREEWSSREVFMTVRIAMTGRKASPPLFETMVAIGREICRRRMRQAVVFLKQYRP